MQILSPKQRGFGKGGGLLFSNYLELRKGKGRRLQELELLQPTFENGKATTYAWRRFALEIRRDSHSRYAPTTTSTEKQKAGYQPGTPAFVMN
jgi:hypothetical protein